MTEDETCQQHSKKKEIVMEYQKFADCVAMPCCVMSVEKTADGHCGPIHIICANKAYKDTMGSAYYDGMPYEELVPKDNKFEDFCFRAAIMKERMHAYVETRALECWTDQTMIPLESDRDDVGYCQYIFEFTDGPSADRMANVPIDTANHIIKACIRLMGKDHFQNRLKDVLNDIMTTAEADACRTLLIDHEKQKTDMFCECFAEGAWPDRNPDNEIMTYDLVKTWEHLIGDTNLVIIKDEADMNRLHSRNAFWADHMKKYGVTSLILSPLRQKDKIIGYMYIVNYNIEQTVKIKGLLELVSFFVGSEISNYLYYHELIRLSNSDELTGLKNRHALMERNIKMDKERRHEPFGIMVLDLNGLKQINDTLGHMAGDQLIIRTAELLKKEFPSEKLYRIGGDEFIVIIHDVDEAGFHQIVSDFMEGPLKRSGISLSIGIVYAEKDCSVHNAFEIADSNMYENKKAFYAKQKKLQAKQKQTQ